MLFGELFGAGPCPEYAIAYLNTLLEENDSDLLLLGSSDVARAYGFTHIASLRVLIGKAFTKRFQKAGYFKRDGVQDQAGAGHESQR